MKKILIFGNSGSGKTTLANRLSSDDNIPHLDLDTICWSSPGIRKELSASLKEIALFIQQHDNWVIEGCYGSLLIEVAQHCTEMYFLNPGVETCLQNNLQRPWEPHKYESKQLQDSNLEMLQSWVQDYEQRQDEYSLNCHQDIFDKFSGKKHLYQATDG